MRFGRHLLFLAVVGIAGVAGCAREIVHPGSARPAVAANAPRSELFPLRPGTFWVYQVRDYDGEVTLQRVLVRGRWYVETAGTEGMIVDESGGVTGELSLDVGWHPVVYYRRGDFLYKYSGLNYVDAEPREFQLGIGEEKILPSDPQRYPAWENDFEVFRVNEDGGYRIRTYSIASAEREPVRVRAGTFHDCLRVETRSVAIGRSPDQKIIYRYLDWYAPGVGLVKSVVEVDEAPRPVRFSELVSYRAAPRHD